MAGRCAGVQVEEAFTLPVAALVAPGAREERDYGARGRMPVFFGGPGGAEVWGLTAFVLDGVLRRVVCPSLGVAHPADHRTNDERVSAREE